MLRAETEVMIESFKKQIEQLQQQQSSPSPQQKLQQQLQHRQKDIERLQQQLIAEQQRLRSEEESHESATAALAAALQEKEVSAVAAAEAAAVVAATLKRIEVERDALVLELRVANDTSAAAAADAVAAGARYNDMQKQNLLLQQQLQEQHQSKCEEVERLQLQLSAEQQRSRDIENERDVLVLRYQEANDATAAVLVKKQATEMNQDIQQPHRRLTEPSSRSMNKTLQRMTSHLLHLKLFFHIVFYSYPAVELALRRSEQVEERLYFAQRQLETLHEQKRAHAIHADLDRVAMLFLIYNPAELIVAYQVSSELESARLERDAAEERCNRCPCAMFCLRLESLFESEQAASGSR